MAQGSTAKNSRGVEERRAESYAVWQEFKARVKDAYPIDRAIEDFAQIKLMGRQGSAQRMGCCPFHGETNPSMSVRPQDGFFRCHSAGCGVKGDVFTFISEYEQVSFKQAVNLAAEKVGMTPPEGTFMPSGSRLGTNARKPEAPRLMNPAKLFESDLVPAFSGSRPPVAGKPFAVWHPGGGLRNQPPGMKRYKPEMVHVYRNLSGAPISVVLRCIHSQGGKYFMPLRIGELPGEAPAALVDRKEGRLGWIVKGTSSGHRKPIYGMENVRKWIASGGRRILIVEGEKTCDAAQRMIQDLADHEDWLILSPMGGHNASLYADWTAFMNAMKPVGLEGVKFSVWPDADRVKEMRDGTTRDPQSLYVRDTIGAFVVAARRAGLDPSGVSFSRALPGGHLAEGWDLADAEEEGWTGEKVLAAIDEQGMKMSATKEFLEMEISLESGDDPAPFEDGSEEIDDLTLSGLLDDDEGSEEGVADDVAQTLDLAAMILGEDYDDHREIPVLEREVEAADILQDDGLAEQGELVDAGDRHDEDILDDAEARDQVVARNTYFRCLGYRDNTNYYMSLRSGQIFAVQYSAMRKQALLSLAPLYFWETYFSSVGRDGRMSIDWDSAISALIERTYAAGYWDPKKEAGQGARIDRGRVVFNTGDSLWVQTEEDGSGVVTMASEFHGDFHYTIGDSCGLPDFDNAFTSRDSGPRELLALIKKLNWREDTANLSAMALFGWLCIGAICGVLPWRPHLWLDGQRAAGKTWIIDNIIKPVLGHYAIRVKSNSTESGLRNILHSRAFPLVFDEAEGEMEGDKARMASIMMLARHSATPGDSIVAQGVAGGNGQRFFSIASTFLLSSITPQLEKSADKTRFARAKLGPGHKLSYFTRELEKPARQLLTPEFSARMIARVIMRANSVGLVQAMMVHALTDLGLERRLADVFGTFAAGAWLLLEDGVPEDSDEAMEWIESTFGIGREIREFAEEIHEDKDHSRLIQMIMAHEVRCDTVNLGARFYNIGSLIDVAMRGEPDDDEGLDPAHAGRQLANIGIRLANGDKLAKEGEQVDGVIIHKNSPRIREILSRTPYATSYVDVIQQAENVKNGPSVRFGGLGTSRSVIVPMRLFPLSCEEDDYGDQEQERRS